MSENTVFDHLASTYDEDFNHTAVGKLQRQRVLKLTSKCLDPQKFASVLEINCGTGVDACWLAGRGHRVVATDISSGMIAVANKRCQDLSNKPVFERVAFSDLGNRFEGMQFDAVFSNFAGLNCLDPNGMRNLSRTMSTILRNGGIMVTVLLGKYCLAERLFFTLKGEKEKALRRQNVATFAAGNSTAAIHCYPKQQLANLFAEFELVTARPVGLFIPPTALNPLIEDRPMVQQLLAFLENVTGSTALFADLGDHIFCVWKKKTGLS
ncbi:MAG: class I SAM-dependent methyltransferase [Salibacteraceae bacterium]